MSARRACCLAAAGLLVLVAGAPGLAPGQAEARQAEQAVARTGPGLQDALPSSPTLAERLEEIQRRVQEAVVYPERARRLGLSGVTRVRFAIGHDGRAQHVETVQSSGHALLDQAAEQGARDASALPYVFGRVEVPVRFALERR
jgi:TonB family protein